jgi:transposase-like protein
MDLLTKNFRKMIIENAKQLKVTMSEIACVTGVSTSQLRYWERKGYIASKQDEQNKNHHFSLVTLFKVSIIKMYLDEGYTLAVAVQKERERRNYHDIFQQFIADCVMGVSEENGQGRVDLGPLSDDPGKRVVAIIEDGKTKLKLFPNSDEEN